MIAVAVFAIMNLVAVAQGDSILLSVAGARQIKREDHPQLWNVVEEMQIASGLAKMPDIYIIDDSALNAFSTGRDMNHASVAITSGLLQKLNRDELQGVIAHEIGHVKNRDVSLMAWCSILLGTIVMLSYFGSRMMFFGGMGGRRSSRSNGDGGGGGGGAAIIIFMISLVLTILAPIFAQLIYFAVSRKREYLADASGVLFTRNPEGLASYLKAGRLDRDRPEGQQSDGSDVYCQSIPRQKHCHPEQHPSAPGGPHPHLARHGGQCLLTRPTIRLTKASEAKAASSPRKLPRWLGMFQPGRQPQPPARSSR